MILNGQKGKGPTVLTLVLPRGDKEEDWVILKAQAILSYKEFDTIYPQPKPPNKVVKGGQQQPDFDNPTYLLALDQYGTKKTQWMFLKSLQDVNDIKWEKVDMADPTTWDKFDQELAEFGFSDIEKQRIIGLITDANCLNERKLEEARESFLSGKMRILTRNGSSSHQDDQKNTSSGELASDKVSVPQA